MRKRLLLAAILGVFCSCSQGYDIYLCIGQSNMAGRGEMTPEDTLALPGVYLLDFEGEPVPARAPLNRYSTIRKRLDLQGINPAWSFAKEMRSSGRRDILLVVNAKGGTSIDQWTKDASSDGPQFYGEAVRRTKQAMAFGHLKGILWHQGEGDSHTPEQRNAYLEKLSAMVADLRSDLGVDVPFIAGEVGVDGKGREINPVLDSIPLCIPCAAIVSAEGLSLKDDNVHFDREAQIELGKRYAAAMLSIVQPSRR